MIALHRREKICLWSNINIRLSKLLSKYLHGCKSVWIEGK